ncbi:hypothetical protein [Adhaeribacter aquaticus]|uniref:hypothetical protein n=1 Tax=Adhaeribacter aquaticus TaxID=299567 RepID=UPI00047E45D1|nr:hypothetical protein [Adhaeribacter aquaticus]
MRYQFNEQKCRELLAERHEGCSKITVHISKDPESIWNGIPIYYNGQWLEDNLELVRNFIDKEPILVRFGAVSSNQCYTEIK